MSYLSELIDQVRSVFKTTDGNIANAVSAFREQVTKTLRDLDNAGNLRIFDDTFGGVLRGPKKSRASLERREAEKVYLSCQEAYFEDDKLEVPYFRALFNSPTLTTDAREPDLDVHLIGYESPLMRKNNNHENRNISPRAISCDLVGLTTCDESSRIVCIEGKVKPHNKSTDIVYGILEAFAYGVCVEYLQAGNNLDLFRREVRACANEFHNNLQIGEQQVFTAAFALAAPKEYFREFFDPRQMTPRKANKRLCETSEILQVVQENEGPEWFGFLILEPACHRDAFVVNGNTEMNQRRFVEPHFEGYMPDVSRAKTLAELREILQIKEAQSES